MNYLADTHILIWAITDSPKLSQNAREILLSENNKMWASKVQVFKLTRCILRFLRQVCTIYGMV